MDPIENADIPASRIIIQKVGMILKIMKQDH